MFIQTGWHSGKSKDRRLTVAEHTHLHTYLLTNCENVLEYEKNAHTKLWIIWNIFDKCLTSYTISTWFIWKICAFKYINATEEQLEQLRQSNFTKSRRPHLVGSWKTPTNRVVGNLFVTTDKYSDGLLSSGVRKEYCLRELPKESRLCFFLFLTKWFQRTVSLGFHRFCRFLTDFRRFFFIGILLFSCSEYVSFFIPRQNPDGFFCFSSKWFWRMVSSGFHRYYCFPTDFRGYFPSVSCCFFGNEYVSLFVLECVNNKENEIVNLVLPLIWRFDIFTPYLEIL